MVRELLHGLTEEARMLEDMALPYETPATPVFTNCVIRIIADEAQQLFDALITADRAFHKIAHSPLAELANENLIPRRWVSLHWI
jgi:hypothetical protein